MADSETPPKPWRDLVDEKLSIYCDSVTSDEPPVCRRIREDTRKHPRSHWTTGPHIGTFLKLLVASTGARRVLELGTFHGYSAAIMASAHPGVEVITVEADPAHAQEARRLIANSRVASRIHVVQTDALAWFQANPRETFDMIFFDSFRSHLMELYDPLLRAVRPGGLLVMDNSFANQGVLDPKQPREIQTVAFNARLKHEPGFITTLLPIRDGILLAHRIGRSP
jgi:caffeoyl-CoA O-methyltransferase